MARMRGIILSGGTGTRLYPMTRAANKQLLPIFNKPMVYYALSTLMLAGCREILLVVNPSDEEAYRRLFGDGRQWGLNVSYAMQAKPGGIAEVFLVGRAFVGRERVGLILGDNLFYGDALPVLAERGANGLSSSCPSWMTRQLDSGTSFHAPGSSPTARSWFSSASSSS